MSLLHRLVRLARLAFIVVSISSAPAVADGVCWQENGGPTFNDGFFVGPSSIAAVRVTAAFAFSASGLEVFSGETPGAAKVAIWSHDAALGKPLAKLTEQSFTLVASKGFQGADFHAPIPIAAGQVFWVAFSLPFTAQSPLDEAKSSLGQVYRTSSDGGASWNGPFQFNTSHYKFRIRGGSGPCAGFTTTSGPGCLGVNGMPRLSGGGCPTQGQTLALRLDAGASSAIGVLTIGFGTQTAPLVSLCALHNFPLSALSIPLVLDLSGSFTLVAPIPPGVPVGDLYLQAVTADSAMLYGFSASNALRVSIG